MWADLLSCIQFESGYLAHFWLLFDSDSSLGNPFLKNVFPTFSRLFIYEMHVRHAVSIAVGVIFLYVRRCRSQDMSSFSHIPKRKTGPSPLVPYIYGLWTETYVFNVMSTASATPNYSGRRGTTCAPIEMQRKICTTRGYSFYMRSVIGPDLPCDMTTSILPLFIHRSECVLFLS